MGLSSPHSHPHQQFTGGKREAQKGRVTLPGLKGRGELKSQTFEAKCSIFSTIMCPQFMIYVI